MRTTGNLRKNLQQKQKYWQLFPERNKTSSVRYGLVRNVPDSYLTLAHSLIESYGF